MKKKIFKYGLNMLLLVAILFGTFYMLFKNQEVDQILIQIKHANKGYLLAGVGMMVIFVSGEALAYHYLFNKLSYTIRIGKCFLLSCIGFFYSSITPGASGGQPVQIYYMTHCGIDMLVGALGAMVITIFYKLVLLLLCGIFILIEPETFFWAYGEIKLLFLVGVIGNLLFVLFLVFVIYKPSWVFKVVSKLILFAGRHRIVKNPEKTLRKAISSLRQYEKGAAFLKNNASMLPRLFLYTFVQRLSFFAVSFFVYKSFGLHGTSFFQLITLQIVLSLSVDILPLPGAAGASENVFVVLYKSVFGRAAVLSGLLLFRSITYYALMLITAVFTLIGHFYITKHKTAAKINKKSE